MNKLVSDMGELVGGVVPRGVYEVVCRDADGRVKWVERVHNLFVNSGLNYLLDSGFGGTEYLGLKGSGTPNAADTMASHATWSEITAYTEGARPTYSHAAAASQQVTNSASKAVFSINANGTNIYGIFCTTNSTKGGTTGTLISATDFASSKSADSGDTLEVTYTVTASNG
jgi:hypothetical protein